MITLKELKHKCLKYWDSQCIQRALVTQENVFPLIITKLRFSSRVLSEQFSKIRDDLQQLQGYSKAQKGFGFSIAYQTITHRQLGRQTIPESIVFETCADFIKFAGLSDEYRDFCNTWPVITNTIPDLSVWLCSHTSKVLEYKTAWPKLLSVVLFLMDNPKPKCYLRELPIPGIDSKFIEQHKSILRDLLDELLISDHINSETQGFLNHGFERRYGFKYPEPLIRFRILDASVFGYPITDMSLPLSQFITLTLPVEHIIVTENKINGLSFPDIDRAIIIFGLGYGLQSLAAIPWFMDKDIYYWGDIDTHGFAMLSQFRSYYPQVRNLLMNEQTLKTFQLMAVEEPEDKRCKATLMHLTNAEQMLYEALCQNSHGKNIRIEQERIDFKYVETYLKQIFIL